MINPSVSSMQKKSKGSKRKPGKPTCSQLEVSHNKTPNTFNGTCNKPFGETYFTKKSKSELKPAKKTIVVNLNVKVSTCWTSYI